MKSIYIKDNFLLNNSQAEKLFFEYAMKEPIIDYHSHLSVKEIALNEKYDNMSKIWLNGDHYKWRAMRANGVSEFYITGNAEDKEKFLKWAETVPFAVKNPLYHWTHMELKNPFGISDRLLNSDTAGSIWNECNEKLQEKEFSVQSLLNKFNVKVVCTTDDPLNDLRFHKKIAQEPFGIKVLPTFRPDKAFNINRYEEFKLWTERLEEASNINVSTFENYLEALQRRHTYFHDAGCRVSDHGMENAYGAVYSSGDAKTIYEKAVLGKEITNEELLKFKSALIHEFGIMDYESGWVQQYHIGPIRNNNGRIFSALGGDTGHDSIGECQKAASLSRMLDNLDKKGKLTKTILYNINPADNEMFAAMTGNYQDGTIPGKIQYGSAWWFLDQKSGIERQIDALSNMGLLSRFIGMLTDSRSFLSFSRHEYFRRVLCNILGDEMARGLIPDDFDLVGPIVKNKCYNNAKEYFGFNV